MDAPTKAGVVEVIDTIGDIHKRLRAAEIKVGLLTEDNESLRKELTRREEDLKHARGVMERVLIVFRAALLLDEPLVRMSVLADALEGDKPLPIIDGRRR